MGRSKMRRVTSLEAISEENSLTMMSMTSVNGNGNGNGNDENGHGLGVTSGRVNGHEAQHGGARNFGQHHHGRNSASRSTRDEDFSKFDVGTRHVSRWVRSRNDETLKIAT
jgi:hypothetical protein